MSFKPEDFLTLAQQLTNQAGNSTITEAVLRSAISRAYYSLYLSALNFARNKDKDKNMPASSDAHGYIQNKFKDATDSNRQTIGNILYDLRRARNRADYGYDYDRISQEAIWLVASAKLAIDKLDGLK